MWVLLIIAHISSYNIPTIAVQDLYNKTQCLLAMDAIKSKVNDKNIEYSCIYIGDDE